MYRKCTVTYIMIIFNDEMFQRQLIRYLQNNKIILFIQLRLI